ncbi:hypothetical protein [Streptomyces sp. NPDC006879]|uniref:SCO4225 family membrane protein n=1 Tax=Streptomyces sp. NPDC006879 TaxID=3364767 RepID=UPI003699B43F
MPLKPPARQDRPVPLARNLALGYLALIAVAGLVRGVAGASADGYLALLYLLTFPGSLLVTVFGVMPIQALLDGVGSVTANSFGPLVYLAGGAAVNVALLWTLAKGARRVRG